MFFTLALYISLTIFVLGILYKMSRWFRLGLTTQDRNIGTWEKLSAVIRSIGSAFWGISVLVMFRTFFLDVLLLRRSFNVDKYRWIMHMFIFWGFILLLLMHALENFISEPFLPGYMSTLNPYLFLRDFFGIMVIAGIIMALYRRFAMTKPRLHTKPMDVVTIVILVVIIFSGFFLKGSKIASQSEFMSMVESYSHIYGYEEEVESLESYWVEKFGLISPEVEAPFSQETLSEGKELHDLYCAHCHSSSHWALLSYGTSKLTYPVTRSSDGSMLVSFFWYLHILAAFAGLAWIPFGKMFHMLISPLTLLVASSVSKKTNPASRAVRRVMELDACTRCGTCSERCSVGVAFESIPNLNILPSEKLLALRTVAEGKEISENQLRALIEGLVVCTTCMRCTDVCPVGINLQDVWTAVREDLLAGKLVEPYVLSQLSLSDILKEMGSDETATETPRSAARELLSENYPVVPRDVPLVTTPGRKNLEHILPQYQEISFNYCFSCKTCTSACPIPDYFEKPGQELGLFPHQIIHATVLGLDKLVPSSRMLWACLGCYQCQEQCPQGVRVADIIYAHKQAALAGLKDGEKR